MARLPVVVLAVSLMTLIVINCGEPTRPPDCSKRQVHHVDIYVQEASDTLTSLGDNATQGFVDTLRRTISAG